MVRLCGWLGDGIMPLGAEKAGLFAAAGGSGSLNYYGDGSDGAVTTSGNVTYTVANKNGSYDGDMYVANYTALTVSAGHTITVDQPCRGLFIYVDGDCTVNGAISMTKMGGLSDPTASGGSDSNTVGASGLQLGLITPSGSSSLTNDGTGFNGAGNAVRTATANQDDISSDGTIFTISKAGATGGAQVSCGGSCASNSGNVGSAGTTGGVTLSAGGGGSGGCYTECGWADTSRGGAGGQGGAFSSGSGGGGSYSKFYSNATGGAGGNYGGAGGNGVGIDGNAASGGAGNPGGSGTGSAPEDGNGGIVWLVVKGDLTIGASGSIEADGGAGGGSRGGGSGGGAVFVLYAGTLSNSGSITATGGGGGGGNGGAGGVHTFQISE